MYNARKTDAEELYEVIDYATNQVVGNTNRTGLDYFMTFASPEQQAVDGSDLGFPNKLVYVGKRIVNMDHI